MLNEFYEEADMSTDPLTRMLRNEGSDDEADVLEGLYRSALYRTRTGETPDFH